MTTSLRVLAVAETGQGSAARSFCEALQKVDGVVVNVVAEDRFLRSHQRLWPRLMARLSRPLDRWGLNRCIQHEMRSLRPDVLLIVKGAHVFSSTLEVARNCGVPTVNLFPDYSPHVYGERLRRTIGLYDAVVSTKPFHPESWTRIYGYTNACVYVGHGYDPETHLWDEAPTGCTIDVILCATGRPEYFEIAMDLAKHSDIADLKVTIAGSGWESVRSKLPSHWSFPGLVTGRSYGRLMREARICIAPLHTRAVVDGKEQPGDQDTMRTYELAAMHTFFLHRRTPFVKTVYDEVTEVPMWDDTAELVTLIRRWLPDEPGRMQMAKAAHQRAVPSCSIHGRAAQLADLMRQAAAGSLRSGVVKR